MKISWGLILIQVFYLLDVNAFIRSRTDFGDPLNWEGNSNSLTIHADPNNNNGISTAEMNSIIDQSISEWNGNADITVTRQTTATIQSGRNDLYFSTAPIFGSSVLAITSVSFFAANGSIVEADIIMNDTVNFSATATDTDNASAVGPYYIGDIISHELGHLFGLSHSQVNQGTMNFTVFKGQYTLHNDDKDGLNSIYNNISKGTIKGTVAGSNSLTGVFGARVEAVSMSTGEVTLSTVSNSDGTFELSSLPLSDTYFLYISPMNTSAGAPTYYSSVQKDFCTGGSSWRGSYFRKCGNGQKGQPQGLEFGSSSSTINAGIISIKCDYDTPPTYSTASGVTNSIDIVQADGTVGDAVTGFFLTADINNNSSVAILSDVNQRKSDKYQIDLSTFDISGRGHGAKDLYLDVKLVAQGLNSSNRINIIAERTDAGFSGTFPNADFDLLDDVTENDHNSASVTTGHDLDLVLRLPLDETTIANNIYDLELIPQALTRGTSAKTTDFFPSSSVFLDSLNHYLLIFSVSEKVGSTYTVLDSKTYTPLEDNQNCMDGVETVAISASVTSKDALERNDLGETEENAVSLCGSIDTSDGPGGGNAAVLCLLTFLIFALQRKNLQPQF